MATEIINRVQQSGLVEINLEDFFPKEPCVEIDIKDKLFGGLVLKEKDFREFIKSEDWSKYNNSHVAITCSADAVIPSWAYMLLASSLQPYAKSIVKGNLELLLTVLYREAIQKIDVAPFKGKRIVIKGCGKLPVPVSAYADLTAHLQPHVISIMYGEPCSTVPVYKAK